jgi:hypothetical protein
MSVKEILQQRIENIPESIAPEIMNYILFLENKLKDSELVYQFST